jgi:hypothetical protein
MEGGWREDRVFFAGTPHDRAPAATSKLLPGGTSSVRRSEGFAADENSVVYVTPELLFR